MNHIKNRPEHPTNTNGDSFRRYPTEHVLGVFETTEALDTVLLNLESKGVSAEDIDLLCGERGADILDKKGQNHGFLAQALRVIQHLGYEQRTLEDYDHHLRSGHSLLAVPVSEQNSKTDLVNALRDSGGKLIRYFGKWSIEDLCASGLAPTASAVEVATD